MLDADNRRLLTDVLCVPEDYELTDALACTYSLDLLALASIPLLCLGHESALAADALGDADVGRQLAGIECVRRSMSKFTVFCQAGAIQVPAEAKSSFVWLEPSIVEVTTPNPEQRGVFHPKLWILRMRSAEYGVRYRVVVLSRNLTFDRSWDVVATLEGDLQLRKNRISDAVPIAEFVKALGSEVPAIRALSAANAARVTLFAEELAKVYFDLPDGVEGWAFWPIGIGKYRPKAATLFSGAGPFKDWADRARQISGRQLLVVSPFLGEEAVKALAGLNEFLPVHLVSNEPILDAYSHFASASPTGLGDGRVWTFESHDAADPLAGLHAKLWIADDGHKGRVWLGSANATDAAFGRNVECLLELIGRKGKFGVETLLRERSPQDGEERIFRDLLGPYMPPSEQNEDAAETQRLQRQLDYMLMDIVAGDLQAQATSSEGGFQLSLQAGATNRLEVRPVTTKEVRALDGDTDWLATFDALALHELTEFWVVTVRDVKHELFSTCVTRVPTLSMPELQERGQAVLARHLVSMDALSQYLGFLLTEGSMGLQTQLRATRRRGGARKSSDRPRPLLETLLSAFVAQPHILEDIDALLCNLGQEAGSWLEEPEFRQLWAEICSARSQMNGVAA